MKKRILLIEHTSSEFIISRLKLGTFLMEQGHEVYALVPAGKEADLAHIRQAGLRLIPYPYERNTTSLGANLQLVRFFIRVFREHRFDLIHSFKFQPNLYAVLARLFSPPSFLVLHITGLGLVFTKERSL